MKIYKLFFAAIASVLLGLGLSSCENQTGRPANAKLLKQIIMPDGVAAIFKYDKKGRIMSIVIANNSSDVHVSYYYDWKNNDVTETGYYGEGGPAVANYKNVLKFCSERVTEIAFFAGTALAERTGDDAELKYNSKQQLISFEHGDNSRYNLQLQWENNQLRKIFDLYSGDELKAFQYGNMTCKPGFPIIGLIIFRFEFVVWMPMAHPEMFGIDITELPTSVWEDGEKFADLVYEFDNDGYVTSMSSRRWVDDDPEESTYTFMWE